MDMLQASHLGHLFSPAGLKYVHGADVFSAYLQNCFCWGAFPAFHKGKARDVEKQHLSWRLPQLQGRTTVLSFKWEKEEATPKNSNKLHAWRDCHIPFGLKVIKYFNSFIQLWSSRDSCSLHGRGSQLIYSWLNFLAILSRERGKKREVEREECKVFNYFSETAFFHLFIISNKQIYRWGVGQAVRMYMASKGWAKEPIIFPSVCWRPLHIPSAPGLQVQILYFPGMGHLQETCCLLLLYGHLVCPWTICQLMSRTDPRELVHAQLSRVLHIIIIITFEFFQQFSLQGLKPWP